MIRTDKLIKNIVLYSVLLLVSSCVSSKKFSSLESEYIGLKNRYDNLGVKSNEDIKLIGDLRDDITSFEKNILDLKENLEAENKRYKEMLDLQGKFKNSSQQEMTALLSKIQKNEEELQKKEDELRARNKKLIELQDALNKNEKAVKELRGKVADALLGFEGKGLTVLQKNGKVYVSMDEKLLFKSGKYDIEKSGESALVEISKVLVQNQDINIMVEGHTDNVQFSGTGFLKDNWDLSVMRATTVVRTLLKNTKLDPKRIIASGRADYFPLGENSTAEGRQKNRRTEIILSPKLDKLLEILDNN